jgi:hypothetical protein
MAKIKKSMATPVDQDRQWKVESAMNTILRYNELMDDKALMSDVQKKAQNQLNTVNNTLKMGGKVAKKSARGKAPVSKKAAPKKVAAKKSVAKKK